MNNSSIKRALKGLAKVFNSKSESQTINLLIVLKSLVEWFQPIATKTDGYSIQRIFAYSRVQPEYGGADIHLSPDGLFLYASNRGMGENTIAIFSANQQNGMLQCIAHQSTYGSHPRNFTIDPSGNFLLVVNLETNNIVVFKRDTKTGLLMKTATEIKVPSPSCLKMREYRN